MTGTIPGCCWLLCPHTATAQVNMSALPPMPGSVLTLCAGHDRHMPRMWAMGILVIRLAPFQPPLLWAAI